MKTETKKTAKTTMLVLVSSTWVEAWKGRNDRQRGVMANHRVADWLRRTTIHSRLFLDIFWLSIHTVKLFIHACNGQNHSYTQLCPFRTCQRSSSTRNSILLRERTES